MKKILFVAILAMSTFSMRASVADLFSVDKATISAEMTDLNTLESFVEMNQGGYFNRCSINEQRG